jgi:DNA-binding CsgD family transcriptional regulator
MSHAMRSKNEALLPLIDRIYESIERPELWPETISALGTLIGGRRDFWDADQSTRLSPGPAPTGLEAGCYGTFFLSREDLRVLDEYAQEFGEVILRFLKVVFLSTLWSQKDIGARETVGLRMTRRYLQSFGPALAGSASPEARSASRKFIAALWEDGRMFSGDHLRAMRLLSPHLDRALRLQMRLNAAALRADMISGALDWLTLGVIVVDRSGLPVWHNRRARQIMDSGYVQLSPTGLVGRTSSDTRSLSELLKGAVIAETQGLLAIHRDDELRPLLLIALPLKPVGAVDALGTGKDAACVVFLSDPDFNADPTADSLRRAFGLTHREAQTAIAIARGNGLKAAAETLGVAQTTARTMLQRAFAKTGTNQQAELAALVLRMLAPLRSD